MSQLLPGAQGQSHRDVHVQVRFRNADLGRPACPLHLALPSIAKHANLIPPTVLCQLINLHTFVKVAAARGESMCKEAIVAAITRIA
jgi:hypothetical protein